MSHEVAVHVATGIGRTLGLLLQVRARPHTGGCVDSPEAPTGVLLLVGSVGISAGAAMVRRLRQRLVEKAG